MKKIKQIHTLGPSFYSPKSPPLLWPCHGIRRFLHKTYITLNSNSLEPYNYYGAPFAGTVQVQSISRWRDDGQPKTTALAKSSMVSGNLAPSAYREPGRSMMAHVSMQHHSNRPASLMQQDGKNSWFGDVTHP